MSRADTSSGTEVPRPPVPLGDVLNRNIATLVEMRRQQEQTKGRQETIADAITRFTGSMVFVYLHLVGFGLWIFINTAGLPLIKKFDPSLVLLAMCASVEAIFLSTFVLISQNRMAAAQDQRAELDLQISLLAEHEITQMVTLLDQMARHIGVPRPVDPDLEDAKSDVNPINVLQAIEHHEQRVEQRDKQQTAAVI